MDKYSVRRSVSIFIALHVGWGRRFYNQNALADFLSVRPATVSGWANRKSDIGLFTLLRICQAFSFDRKEYRSGILEFLDILDRQKS